MIAGTGKFTINIADLVRFPKTALIALLILTSAVIGLSLWPDNWMGHLAGVPTDFDKIGHFSAYLVLSALTVSFATGPHAIWIAILVWLGVGTGLEGLQYFLPHRWPSYYDLAANFGGVFVGAGIGGLIGSRIMNWRATSTHHHAPNTPASPQAPVTNAEDARS
ncbi:MAG: VanZ family protein [Parvibaculum sp.]